MVEPATLSNTSSIGNRRFGLDSLRVKTDQQLIELKSEIDKLIADLPRTPGTSNPWPLAVKYIAEYLYRTDGFDCALTFIETLDRELPSDTFNVYKIQFFMQHGRTVALEAYIQELNQRKITSPSFKLLCLKHYLSLRDHQRAEAILSSLIVDDPESIALIDAITLTSVFSLEYDRNAFTKNVRWGGKFLALETRIVGIAGGETRPIVNCINLDQSPQRMTRCNDLYREKAQLNRIPAIVGDALPEYLLAKLNINPALPRSAVGTSLSHIAAWEKIARSDEASPAQIIVEDDGLPLIFSNGACNVSQQLMRQKNLDLLYIHEAASPLIFAIREFSARWQPEALPFEAGLDRFITHQRRLPTGWGTYGYFLTVSGARKLLTLLARDGLTNHLDWQTFLYSATDWNHPMMHAKKNVDANYRRTTGRSPKNELTSGILNFPMIAIVDFVQSTR